MSSVNSVSVHSIDEEKLKFRVIIGIHADAVYDGRGVYDINIPIPVALVSSVHPLRRGRMLGLALLLGLI